MNRVRASSSRGLVTLLIVIIFILVVGIVAVLAYMGISMGWFKFPGSSGVEQSHVVTYRVKSSNSVALVSYTLADGSSSDTIKISTPWQMTFSFSNIRIYLSTANPGNTGDLECEILVDGVSMKRQKVSSPVDKVGCSVYIP